MPSLLDLAPSTVTVDVGGVPIAVYGVSAKGIAGLLRAFPDLKNAFTGGEMNIDVATIFDVAPDAIAAIIAAGTGNPGDPKAIEAASNIPAATQLEMLDKIIELTMPRGIRPFMEALDAIVGRLDLADTMKAPATNSHSLSKPS